ncbi:MAG: DASH complex subunit dam1 [Sclerophora amabilis]|nr:MAG: DASH complex subunit dam1 [Sclerophora amabilis]
MSSSTTPLESSGTRNRSQSRPRHPTSRPTTPLRPSSRSSLRESNHGNSLASGPRPSFPLDSLEPAFAELSDSMADLEANFMHIQLMHESLSRFSESFASFLYGLNMNAFCVDFPEVRIPRAAAKLTYGGAVTKAPIAESFKRARQQAREQESEQMDAERASHPPGYRPDYDAETTFMTTDTSFVDNPATATASAAKPHQTPRFTTPASTATNASSSSTSRIATSATGRASRGRGLGRGRERGTTTGRAGSGLARARARGRDAT